MTKYRTRSRGMQLRVPRQRAAYETDEFISKFKFGTPGPVFQCARSGCRDQWIEGLPEVTWLIGGSWFHFHYECVPKAGNLALEVAAACSRCAAPLPLDGWGWRTCQGEGGFESRMAYCLNCSVGVISVRRSDDGESDVQDGAGVRRLVCAE